MKETVLVALLVACLRSTSGERIRFDEVGAGAEGLPPPSPELLSAGLRAGIRALAPRLYPLTTRPSRYPSPSPYPYSPVPSPISPAPSNFLLSPPSVALASALLTLASPRREGGDWLAGILGLPRDLLVQRGELVHEGLSRLLGGLQELKEGSVLKVGSGLFLQRGLLRGKVSNRYAELATRLYGARVLPLDFAANPRNAAFTINRWVYEATEGKIPSIVDEDLDPETRAVIVSAIYFNAEWLYPFLPRSTQMRAFHVSPGETIEVETMVNAAEVYWRVDKERGYKAVGLPYKGEQLTMYVVVPGSPLPLDAFVANFTGQDIQDLVRDTHREQVIFTLPRMRLEGDLELSRALKELAGGTELRPEGLEPGARLGRVLHRVLMEITETGTTAAAVTGVTLNRDGSTPVLRVDSPFLLLVHHRSSDLILFYAAVTRPTPVPHPPP